MKERHRLHFLADTIEARYPGVKVNRDDIPDDVLQIGPTSLTLYIRDGLRVAYAPADVAALLDSCISPMLDRLVWQLRDKLADTDA